MSSYGCVVSCLALVLLLSVGAHSQENEETMEPAKIRFYTGNLTVDYFIHAEGGGPPGGFSLASPEFCERMKSISVSAMCDYVVWRMIEPEQDKWDWTLHDQNRRILHEHRMEYNVFCWLHFPPEWFMETDDYVPYRCAEHDLPVQQTSIWAPGTLKIYERFYKQLAEHFGDDIDFIRLATPAEYGELGYPNGMTNWIVKQDHYHPGFWCNDEYARADFKEMMSSKYASIEELNKTWGTTFASFDDLEYPDIARDREAYMPPLDMSPQQRRQILDFVGWYYGKQERFARKAIDIVRKYFPDKEIIVSMGYGSQRAIFGNDDVGIAQMSRDMNVACQTPGNIPYFYMKSLASACHFYDVPYFTEPPGGVDRNAQVNRIWADASCGTQTFFDYPQNLLGAKDLFEEYRDYFDGTQSVVDVAIFFPTTDHRLRDQDWPQQALAASDAFREHLDYDLVDERMIRDNALDRYRVLLLCEGNIVQAETLAVLEDWISKGGIVVVKDFGSIETLDGDLAFYNRVLPPAYTLDNTELTTSDLMQNHSRRIGSGTIVRSPQDITNEDFASLAADLAHNLSRYCPGKQDVPRIDGAADGIRATLFPNRILYLNSGSETIDKVVHLRMSDFPEEGRTGQPEKKEYRLEIEPHSIAAIDLL